MNVLRYLLTIELPINAVDKEGKTALHYAVIDHEIVRLLLQHGADPNVRDCDGNRPIDISSDDIRDLFYCEKTIRQVCTRQGWILVF